MRKILLTITVLLAFVLVSCNTEETSGNYYVLPELAGKDVHEIAEIFQRNNQSHIFHWSDVQIEEYSMEFIMYENFDTGDIVNNDDVVKILLYPEFVGERTFIELPDLEGYNKEEIEEYFDDYGINISFSYTLESTVLNQGLFTGYGGFYEIGDRFYLTSSVSVIIYKDFINVSTFFYPIEMEYDGPLLNPEYESIDPLDPRGGYFEVDLNYCGDGDTAVFHYPIEIYDAIISSSKSVRFLNMDTEETFSGGEEEWGKPASVYTCSLLTQAESIVLQTDPEALTGTYGRLLAWVWVKLPGETEYFLLNYMVVKQGLARVAYEYGNGEILQSGDYTYKEWMHIAEDYAQLHELGQWGDLLDYYWDYQNDSPNFFRWNE